MAGDRDEGDELFNDFSGGDMLLLFLDRAAGLMPGVDCRMRDAMVVRGRGDRDEDFGDFGKGNSDGCSTL